MAHGGKRPFSADELKGSIVIDLTDEGPPPKKQRSESRSAPRSPTLANTSTNNVFDRAIANISLDLSTSSISPQRAIQNDARKGPLHPSLGSSNRPTKPAISHRGGIPNGFPITNGHSIIQKPDVTRNLVNGKNGLPHRSSPRPRPAQSQLTAPSPKLKSSLLPADVIDLDTDSDRASEKTRPSITRDGSFFLHSIPAKIQKPKPSNFQGLNTQPIESDLATQQPSKFSESKEVNGSQHSVKHSVKSEMTNKQPVKLAASDEANSSHYPAKHVPKIESDLSHPKPIVRVNLPLSTTKQQEDLARKLKQDVNYIDQSPEDLLRLFRMRPFDNKDLNKELHNKVRQKKYQQTVDRSKVSLDFASEPTAPLTSKRIRLIHPRTQARDILNDPKRFKYKHQGQAPLDFDKSLTDRRINGKFQFISDYVFSRKARGKNQAPHPLRNCACVNTSGFCHENCGCLVSQIVTKSDDKDVDVAVRTYRRHAQLPNLVILSDALIEDKTHTAKIFECNDSCRCPKDCINRVVQRGRTLPLQIFETGKYGFGIRSSLKILRGQFIDIYLGEVLTEPEVAKREAAAEEDTPSYIMSLDAFITDEKAMFYIDGENFGSVTRFVNHSCEPNCKIIPVVLPKGTKHLYYVAFFAIKDIEVDEELTIDYDPDLLDEDQEEIVDGVVRCQCGSKKCRKRLWAPGREKRGKRKKYLPSRDDD